MDEKIHVFEKAGLGMAPFQFIRIEQRIGPIDMGNGYMVGTPGQPMGTCGYCGASLKDCCIIRDTNGKEFIVGTTCVYKTDDKGLINVTKREVNKKKNESRRKREDKRIATAKENLIKVSEALETMPHPYEYMAQDGHTALSFVKWMFGNAGNSGMMKAARMVEKVLKSKKGE